MDHSGRSDRDGARIRVASDGVPVVDSADLQAGVRPRFGASFRRCPQRGVSRETCGTTLFDSSQGTENCELVEKRTPSVRARWTLARSSAAWRSIGCRLPVLLEWPQIIRRDDSHRRDRCCGNRRRYSPLFARRRGSGERRLANGKAKTAHRSSPVRRSRLPASRCPPSTCRPCRRPADRRRAELPSPSSRRSTLRS